MPGGTSTTLIEGMIAQLRRRWSLGFWFIFALVAADIALHIVELACR